MTSIPLSNDDVDQLARLAFAWNVSPQEALRTALANALATLDEVPGNA